MIKPPSGNGLTSYFVMFTATWKPFCPSRLPKHTRERERKKKKKEKGEEAEEERKKKFKKRKTKNTGAHRI